jgi:hypothetical protein
VADTNTRNSTACALSAHLPHAPVQITYDCMLPLLRALLAAAKFPALRALAVDVTLHERVEWLIPPFPADVFRDPVLAASIASALHSLKIRFTNKSIDRHDRADFLRLFGMEGRPDVVDVVGIPFGSIKQCM